MKRLLLLLAAARIIAPSATAQLTVTTRQVCERNCKELELGESPRKIPYDMELARIRQLKKAETDPAKRKLLDEQEQDAIDRRADFIERTCSYICATNPDE
ncbi:hypothetical protein [Massilia sp.]|uniref:hypothetical protein n=1 Tax=Massilia sp. TaxID=1882437 RepID=UPI00391B7174